MVIPRALFILLGILAATSSGAVLKSYPYPPPFEVYGVPEQAPLLQYGIPNFLATPMMPIPMQYGKSDCEEDHHLSTDFDQAKYLAAYEEEMSKHNKLYSFFPQVPLVPIYPEFPMNIAMKTPTTDIPCEEDNFVVHEEPKKEQIIIPELPVLPILSLPEMPVPVISDKNIPCDEFAIPDIPEEPKKEESIPIIIPEAPILSPLSLPEMPTEIIEMPHNDYVPAPLLPEHQKIEEITPVMLPEAPVLAPLPLPELPTKVEVTPCEEEPKLEVVPILLPEAPMLPPLSMPELPTNVYIEELPDVKEPVPTLDSTVPETPIAEETIPAVLPESPLLPALTLPELPTKVEVTPYVEEPKIQVVPILIPEAPMLPPLSMPELPTNVYTEVLPDVKEPLPTLVSTVPEIPIAAETIPAVLPESPLLPALALPELPDRIEVVEVVPSISENLIITAEEPEKEHIQLIIPEAPMLSPYVAPEFPTNMILDEPAPIVTPVELNEVIVPDSPEITSAQIVEPCVHPKSDSPLKTPKLFINDQILATKELTPIVSAPAPIVVQAPMQIVVHGSELSKMSGSADCLYKYLTNRIISNIV